MRNTTRTRARKRPITDSYFALAKRFPLRPIRNDAEHAQGLKIASELIRRGDGNLDTGEGDYLETLAQLLSTYERQRLTLRRPTPREALVHLMQSRGMGPADLARVIGSSSAASMILRGDRQMSKTHIRKLADHFGVSTDLFI